MGASNGYCRPISNPTGLSTWTAHTNRGVPSTEPGTDYYTPSGTSVLAAASGVVVDTGDSVYPATGRFVTIDLDDGRRVRYLHLSRRRVSYGDRVQWGQHIADSGASGYGSDFFGEPYRNAAFWNNTGGDHVHMTLWAGHYYQFGRYATLDPELYMSANQGGNSSEPIESEEDDMGYYFYDVSNPNRPYRFFSEARGKSRAISRDEWEARKAIASTANGVKYDLVGVSANWYGRIVALGEY